MKPPRTFLLALAIVATAGAALAQSTPASTQLAQSPAEFGRASGGSIDVITKGPHQFSGSLSLGHSLGGMRGQGYNGTIGGTLVNDRVWFFGSAALDATSTAQPFDWNTITTSLRRSEQPPATQPASFLMLRSTSALSDRTTLNVNLSRR
jgi:hypothetical protein